MHAEQVLYFFSYCLSDLINLGKKPATRKFKSILVIKLDEIGDMVYAIPVFRMLKDRYPNSDLTLYCKKAASRLLGNEKCIDEIVFVQPKEYFDLVVDLRGTFKTLLFTLTHPPKIRLDRGTVRLKNKLKGQQAHELITNISVLDPLKLVIAEIDKIRPSLILGEENLNVAAKFIEQNQLAKFCILHTGARDRARRWPFERFIELATRIKSELNLDIVFAGGPEESEEIDDQMKNIPFKTYSFAGKGSLLDFAALCNKASLFVGNESGPMHIANTFDIPLVALFGPGVKNVFYPLGDNAIVIHYFKEKNHTNQSVKDSTIMKITVDEVLRAVNELRN